MKNLLFIFPFLLFASNAFAQKEGNTWYFGDMVGIDFNSGAAVLLTDGAMNAFEGCSSISDDETGELKFYTNGQSVWNASHQVMPNGTGLTADYSSAQAATIVPAPGDTNLFYIFTAGEYTSNGFVGYRYSIVDMTLAGGLGDVTATKNELMYAPACEKLAVVQNAAGDGFWIATHETVGNNFVVYPLTAAGLGVPVVSSVGTVYNTSELSIGYIKFSSDGSRLATVLSGLNNVELFDFDAATGVVSNPIVIGPIGQTNPYVYGISFSPNGNLLYATEENDNNIYQYDLTSGNAADINASKTIVGTSSGTTMQTIQLAPDGKLYVCRNGSNFLAAIHQPDSLGLACNFVDDGFSLGNFVSPYGLPALPESVYSTGDSAVQPQASIVPTVTKICESECIAFDNNSTDATSFEWFFPGANPSFSNAEFPSNICYSATGNYDVMLVVHNGPFTDTMTLGNIIGVYATPLPEITFENDTLFCNNTLPSDELQWFVNNNLIPGATSTFHVPLTEGVYSVEVISSQDCLGYDSLAVLSIGMADVGGAEGFAMYPNPADATVNLELNGLVADKILVYNTLGQVVFDEIKVQSHIDVSALPSGVYYVVLKSQNGLHAQRLVVSRH